MIKPFPLMAFAVAVALFAVPVAAQDPANPDQIILESKSGSVMTSTGGAYQTATQGKVLVVGESLMLTEGAMAKVAIYQDGTRKCVQQYAGPNTFVIDGNCSKGAWAGDGSGISPGKAAAIIAGAGLLGAAILESMDDEPVGPLSTGPNGTIRHL